MARDKKHTITLPAGAQVNAIKFEGKCRYTSDSYADASLIELNGESLAEGTYALKEGETDEFTAQLATPAIGTLTFTFTGNNPDCTITLYTSQISTAIREIGKDQGSMADDAIYDLQGRRCERSPPLRGIYIRNGKKFIVQ